MFKEKLDLKTFMNGLRKRNENELEFHQAVGEVAESLIPFINENKKYLESRILERLTEPDRIIVFRVCWQDDAGNVRINRGYRVQFNNSIGPYKGGLRFHPSVSLSILKFLGFEQIFKNSLTTLPIGGAKGGSNFNPKGKSDREVMSFCQAFMTELSRHIGPQCDIPAGDIGVGAREIGYMFGQVKRLTNQFTGSLTGKGIDFGGSLIRTEATGYGAVYFAREMLTRIGDDITGKTCVVSGSGNVAQYATEKILQLGGKVVAMSDSTGFLYEKHGIDQERLEHIKFLKNVARVSLDTYLKKYPKAEFHKGKRPWGIKCDLAFPCATQNEIEAEDAKLLVDNKCIAVVEGANMPTSIEAVAVLDKAGVMFAPGKAANAGGVAVSGLEMTQNSMFLQWEGQELDKRLQDIMHKIHKTCVRYGKDKKNKVNYLKGANIGGFVKVADTMLSYGVI
jgi:glutamate dehydrogenase (NADP+)